MNEFFLVVGVHFLALMSPGPDFAMVLRNSLVYSRRVGIMAALGLGLGTLLHVTYSLLGIGLIISQSIVLFNVIKLLGAGYLIYVGIKSLLAKKPAIDNLAEELQNNEDISNFAAIRLGFLTNALNPKATLFFLALFTQVISPTTGVFVKAFYGLEMSVATVVWFSVVALLLTHPRVNKAFAGVKHHLERAFGAVLIALGIKVALGAHK
jgi:RhtB (resistance to homoserine/threonine) family protein